MTIYAPLRTGTKMPMSSPRRVEVIEEVRQMMIILGVPIDNLSMGDALDRIEEFVQVGRETGKTHQVATVNTDFLVRSLDDLKLRNLLQKADMCTADGMPLVWGSKLLGVPLKERVAGSDMVPLIAERAAEKQLSLYFMGAGPGVAEKAKTLLEAQYPGLNVVGTACPYWKPGEEFDTDILADIRAKKPDVLLVAFGNPKQEWWIQEYGDVVGVPVSIGVGASLDFVVGTVKRAPTWMQRTGLEWAARLAQEPNRLWKRYATDLVRFGPSIMQQWWVMRKHDGADETSPNLAIETRNIDDTSILNLRGSLTRRTCHRLLQHGQRAIGRRAHLTVNLAETKSVDCVAIGTLMQLKESAETNGGSLRVVGLSKSLTKTFSLLNLDRYFEISQSNMMFGYQS